VPDIKIHSVKGRTFHIEIGYDYFIEVLCAGCAFKIACRESGHVRPLSPRGVSVRIFPEAVT
jgi:hypothetical protein